MSPVCIAYIRQEIYFIVPTHKGWAEIFQYNKISQAPKLRLNNKRPEEGNPAEKEDLGIIQRPTESEYYYENIRY